MIKISVHGMRGTPGSFAYLFLIVSMSISLSFHARAADELRAGSDVVGNDDYFNSGFSFDKSVTIGNLFESTGFPQFDAVQGHAYFIRNTGHLNLIKFDLKQMETVSETPVPGGVWMVNAEAGHIYLVSEEYSTGPQTVHKYALGGASESPHEVARALIPRHLAVSDVFIHEVDPAGSHAWYVVPGTSATLVQLSLGDGDSTPTLAGTLPIGRFFKSSTGGEKLLFDSAHNRLYLTIVEGDTYTVTSTRLTKIAVEPGPNPLRLVGSTGLLVGGQPAHLLALDEEDRYGIAVSSGAYIAKVSLGNPESMPEVVSTSKRFAGTLRFAADLDSQRDRFYLNIDSYLGDLIRFQVHDAGQPPEMTGALALDGDRYVGEIVTGPAGKSLDGWNIVPSGEIEISVFRCHLDQTVLQPWIFATRINVQQPMDVESVQFYSRVSSGTLDVAIYTTGTHQTKIWSGGRVYANGPGWITVSPNLPDRLRLQPGEYELAWHSQKDGNVPAFSADVPTETFVFQAESDNRFSTKLPRQRSFIDPLPFYFSQRGAFAIYLKGKVGPTYTTLHVPSEFLTIQRALNYAKDGDRIVVAPGTYSENVYFPGRNIILTSTDPFDEFIVQRTIIDGGGQDAVLNLAGNESPISRIRGFTIRNGGRGADSLLGGGINGFGSKGQIDHNTIVGNSGSGLIDCDGLIEQNAIIGNLALSNFSYRPTPSHGGGLVNCGGIIRRNRIIGNSADVGSALANCFGTIENNHINDNSSSYPWAFGSVIFGAKKLQGNFILRNSGGVASVNGSIINNLIAHNSTYGMEACSGVIENNTLYDNYFDFNQTKIQIAHCTGKIENNILWATNYSNPVILQSTTPTFSCIANWTGGGIGNFSSDPRFVNPSAGDFHLSAQSPCLDRGKLIPEITHDLDGRKRGADILHTVNGDGSNYDIGAYEAHLFTVWPNGGETWRIGQRVFVEWTANLDSVGSAVGLELWRNGVFAAYLGTDWNPAAHNRRQITVPNVQPGANYQVRTISLWDGSYWDFSDGNLSIVADPNFRSAADPAAWLLYD